MRFKKTKKKLTNTILKVIIILVAITIAGVGIYYFLTAEDEDNGLTLLEKQWIESNKSTLVDINVPNNINIYANSGHGVLFDFLSYVTDETSLAFNKIPYVYPSKTVDGLSIAILKNNDTIRDTDLLIFEDNYVVSSLSNDYIETLSDMNNSSIGILEEDSSIIPSNFSNSNINFKKYSDIDNLIKALNDKQVSYIILPRYVYLSDILKSNIYINYTIENLSNKFVLRLGSSEKINVILTKLLNNWLKNSYRDSFEKYLVDFYIEKTSLTDLEKSTLSNRVYKYGYVTDSAYSFSQNNHLYGIAGEYINTLSTMAGMEFEYISYSSVSGLKKDLNDNKLDIAYIDFSYDNEAYLKTNSVFVEKFSVLGKNYKSISNKNGLNNTKMFVKSNNYLKDYLTNNINGNINTIKNYTANISDDGLLVIDENEYYALKNTSLLDYKYLFSDTFEGNYTFLVKSNNEVLYNLTNFTLNNSNYNAYKTMAINNLLSISTNENNFKGIYMIIVAIILLPIFVVLLSIIIIKNTKKLKISKKENMLKYNDILTNLKNRNYLNDNIEKWDNTKIFPRTIVIIDLNNLKYVNDNYGHEEGNELIKKAAAVLINTQLEKSDIIRTDGNEYLIYLIGYSKTQINTYLSKLAKEFERLPYGFGAAMGYSVIDDEIKTIDDAINEATIEMRIDKEKNYR